MAELRVDDFTGGITDFYLNGPLNASKTLDNFLINRNRKPEERPGSALFDDDYYQIPAGNQRIAKVVPFKSVLFQHSARNVYYVNSGWQTLTGPSGNPFFGAGTISNYSSFSEWNGHLYATIDAYSTPRKLYKDGSSVWRTRTAGLPKLASGPTITPSHNDAKTYIYDFHYQYNYSVGTISHVDRGATTSVEVANASDMSIGGHTNQITAIPVITNGSTENYDTTAIKVRIYRTESGGVVRQYVGEVTNGTTSFSDTVADTALGEAVYTDGGVVDNDSPPQAKYLVIANDIGWYADVKEGSEEKTFRVRQSLQYDIDACPESFFTDVDEDIKAIGAVGIYPLVFSERKIWRFEGYVDNQGRGFVRKRVVSDVVGAVGQDSLISTIRGIFFASLDGFYFTDGFNVQKLSENLNERYPGFVDTETKKKRICGTYDRVSGRCYWAVQADAAGSENDALYVLDPYWGLTTKSCFSTWSSGVDMKPTSLTFVDNDLVRADSRGYVFQHYAGSYNDMVVNTAAAPSTWQTKAVIYDYTSCAQAFGSELMRKMVVSILVVAKNETNLSLLVQSLNDDSNVARDLREIRFRNNVVWGDDIIWGDPDITWNYQGVIQMKRMFPRNTLRCTYKQIRMTNAETVIARSDDYGTATADGAANTVLLDDAVTENWPTDILGYWITFDFDDYTREYPISIRSNDTITVLDPGNTLQTGSHKWLIKGYRKNEKFGLEAYTLDYQVFGESHPGFRSTEAGENA